MQRITFIVATIILLFPITTGAVPQFLNHQGYLSGNTGEPISGSVNATFNIYTVETEGSTIWSQTIPVTFDGGYYSVVLGPGTPELSVEIFDGSELYMGITLEEQNEFLPRIKIISAPYAFMAGAVEGEVKAVGGLVVDGVEVISDQQQWAGTNMSFNDLADVPSEWADGDDVGLEGSGTDGTLAKFTESGVEDSVVVTSDGKIGVGLADPQSALHVAGGVQIADDSGDCVEGKEGTLRWHENTVEVCDGNSWEAVGSLPMNGEGQEQAGLSCKAISEAGYAQDDGIYWIDPDGDPKDNAFEVYCNMTDGGGGWTLAMNINPSDGHRTRPWCTTYFCDSNDQGAISDALTADYKSGAVWVMDADEIMITNHLDGTVKAWKTWNFLSPQSSMQSLFENNYRAIVTTDIVDSYNTDSSEVDQCPMMRYDGALYLNFRYSNNGAKICPAGQYLAGEGENSDNTYGIGMDYQLNENANRAGCDMTCTGNYDGDAGVYECTTSCQGGDHGGSCTACSSVVYHYGIWVK